ncbi:hypothetical protein [Streptomyces rubiginosohelvolus]|uniref:hypothetical protein n=1 Tax=Streptomyces rubiginosohelvolus TaxID=67362 RepID=UPI0035D872FD
MATAARTRKTTPKTEQADTPAPAADETAGDATQAETTASAAEEASSTPKAPEAAPLEPPTVEEAPEPPAEPAYATPTEVIPDEANLADVILDDATQKPPADPDKVFQPVTPYGSSLVCTVRLIEVTHIGPHSNPIHRLLQPAGAHVSEGVAARILERLRAQSAPADTEK